MLKDLDAEIITADSGEAALHEAAVQENIALILLDVNLPGIDGFEVCIIRQKNPETHSIPIIFFTANQKNSRIELDYLAGAVDYL